MRVNENNKIIISGSVITLYVWKELHQRPQNCKCVHWNTLNLIYKQSFRELRHLYPASRYRPIPFLCFVAATSWHQDMIHCEWRIWWLHQMETFSALLTIFSGNSPVTSEFPAQRQVTRSFDAFFDLRLNKRLSEQLWGWWFERPSRPSWRHCNTLWSIWINDSHESTAWWI